MAYSTIDKSSLFQNNVLYTGTSGTTDVTGVGFEPSLIWAKDRGRAENPCCYDAVRGGGKRLLTSASNAENDEGSNGISAFNSDGFTCGQDGSSGQDGENYVAWNWKAGTTSGLSGGTITPTAYSINTTSGIGIYHYNCTGANATIAHGLSSAPKMLITKSLGDTSPWAVWHTGLTDATKYLVLNTTAAEATGAAMWNSTAPSSSVISLGTDGQTNGTGKNNIMYAFSEVTGYSAFGRYKGNGNASGPYIYTGFKPSFIMVKRYDSGTINWVIADNKREGYNPDNDPLYPDVNVAEGTADNITICSTGFKIINSGDDYNNDGGYYIYAAFGQPIVGSNGVVATGR